MKKTFEESRQHLREPLHAGPGAVVLNLVIISVVTAVAWVLVGRAILQAVAVAVVGTVSVTALLWLKRPSRQTEPRMRTAVAGAGIGLIAVSVSSFNFVLAWALLVGGVTGLCAIQLCATRTLQLLASIASVASLLYLFFRFLGPQIGCRPAPPGAVLSVLQYSATVEPIAPGLDQFLVTERFVVEQSPRRVLLAPWYDPRREEIGRAHV